MGDFEETSFVFDHYYDLQESSEKFREISFFSAPYIFLKMLKTPKDSCSFSGFIKISLAWHGTLDNNFPNISLSSGNRNDFWF